MNIPEGGTLFSLANRRRVAHWTWVPEGRGPFPLVVLLHGVYDAGGFVWWQKGRAHDTAARLMRDGVIPPAVLLMAGDTGAEQGTGYCDWADRTTLAETYLVDELLRWADDILPTDGRRHVTGLSMGGYGALLLALRHPGLFASATATSGFFDPLRLFDFVDDASERMWGGVEGQHAHDVRLLLDDKQRRAGLRIAFDCGTDDPLLDESRALHAQLEALDVAHGYAEHAGGHDWSYWEARLEDHLRFHFDVGGPLAAR